MFRFVLFAVSVWACCAPFASSATYDFIFDDLDDGVIVAPFVGFGSLSFDGSPPEDGAFGYESFSSLRLQFQFSGVSGFTEADAITPLDEVLLVFSENGQRLQFSNVNPSGTGQFTGAFDFLRDDGMMFGLSTEPPSVGGNLDRYFLGIIDPVGPQPTPIHFGNYGGTLVAVPEPSSIAMVFAGLAALGLFVRKRRRG